MKLSKIYRKWKSIAQPYEWQRQLLGLEFSEAPRTQRGLVLIQIDGLSFPDLKRAMAKKHMPFLSRLMRRENYHLHPMYSGIPSNTPAFQGAFFFGKEQCVPAFQYRDAQTGDVRIMFDKTSAAEVEKKLLEHDEGLIKGGSAYGNIFSGGAAESHICASTADWGNILKAWNPYSMLVTFIFSPLGLIRTLLLCVTEAALAFFDFLRGSLNGQDIIQELSFILTRLFGSIVIRDVATAHAKMDIYRGLPVVHVNYFGYDEQAHRRGPSTRFAYWSLSGIDAAAKKLWKAAHHAKRRHYDIWIYSDHGQEKVTPFAKAAGKKIQTAAKEVYDEMRPQTNAAPAAAAVRRVRGNWGDNVIGKRPQVEKLPLDKNELLVTTLGPICQIYFPVPFSDNEKRLFARKMIEKNPVTPLVCVPLSNGKIEYFRKDGVYHLPADAEEILGKDHPYLYEVARDLETLFCHDSRGDILLFGWAAGSETLSYSNENGAHAGLGPRETQAFALLSEDAPLKKEPASKEWISAMDLRQAALSVLGRTKGARRTRKAPEHPKLPKLRVLSYNVHSCIGTDGVLSVERIARVIAKADPDVVALQELDSGRRIKGEDQAAAIARELEMHFHFHSVCGIESQCFGNAILSRYPMKMIRAELLPMVGKFAFLEPRGILAVEIDFQGKPVRILNTHLSLWAPELKQQVQKLVGPEIIGTAEEDMILCGDFNLNEGSVFYKKLRKVFNEPDFKKNAGVYSNTWPSKWPIRRLDHIFMRGRMAAEILVLPRTRLERSASDHLPIAADFEFQ